MSCRLALEDTLQAVCFNHGSCTGTQGTGCVCQGQYDPLFYCEQLTYASLHRVDVVIKFIYIIILVPIAVLTFLEIIFDLWLRIGELSLKRPKLLVKLLNLALCIARLVRLSMEIYESLTLTNDLDSQITFITMIGLVVASPIYILIVVNWISLLLQAKALSEDDTGMRRFRLASIILAFTMTPLLIVFSVLAHVEIGGSPVRAIALAISIIVLLIELVGSSVYLVKLFIWLSKNDDNPVMLRAKRRTYPILVTNADLSLGIINMVAASFIALEMKGAWASFILHDVLGSVSTTIPIICYFLFTENYFTAADGWYGRGYWLLLRGDESFNEQMRKFSIPYSTTSARHNSGGNSSGSSKGTPSPQKTPKTARISGEEPEKGS
jgi:hypothetical protein